jgi:dihydroceramide fatty acyl 2-hydroxylase
MQATEKRSKTPMETSRPVCEKSGLMQTAYKSIRLFKSPYLEWFSHIHPLTPLVIWGPISGWFIWRAVANGLGVWEILGVGAFALLVWSLAEYVLHRFVFHWHPKGELLERLHFIVHGIHHADPVDPTRLVMSPPVALILALLLYPLFRLALGPTWIEPFFGFFLIGYLIYDYTHYAVHHFRPRTRWGKKLKQNHMIHHYVNPELRWGVSSPLWDWVFGTYKEPVPARKARSGGAHAAKPGLAKQAGARSASRGQGIKIGRA